MKLPFAQLYQRHFNILHFLQGISTKLSNIWRLEVRHEI